MATVSNLISNETKNSEFIKPREVKKTCLIVIAGDRGLAGGYNGNIYKKTDAVAEGKSVCILPIGKRTVEHMIAHKYEILSDKYISTEKLTLSDCAELGRDITERFKNGEFDKVELISTKYVSMLALETFLVSFCMKIMSRGILSDRLITCGTVYDHSRSFQCRTDTRRNR